MLAAADWKRGRKLRKAIQMSPVPLDWAAIQYETSRTLYLYRIGIKENYYESATFFHELRSSIGRSAYG